MSVFKIVKKNLNKIFENRATAKEFLKPIWSVEYSKNLWNVILIADTEQHLLKQQVYYNWKCNIYWCGTFFLPKFKMNLWKKSVSLKVSRVRLNSMKFLRRFSCRSFFKKKFTFYLVILSLMIVYYTMETEQMEVVQQELFQEAKCVLSKIFSISEIANKLHKRQKFHNKSKIWAIFEGRRSVSNFVGDISLF